MMILYQVIGAVVVLAVACAALALSWLTIMHASRKQREKRDDLVALDTARRIGNMLLGTLWWFGEHPKTAIVLRLLATSLTQYGTFDEARIRDEWREQIESERYATKKGETNA